MERKIFCNRENVSRDVSRKQKVFHANKKCFTGCFTQTKNVSRRETGFNEEVVKRKICCEKIIKVVGKYDPNRLQG